MVTNLLNEDIQVLRAYKGDCDWDNLYWGFTCYSRQNYAKKGVENFTGENFDDEIMYGVIARSGGCLMEMLMAWETLADDSVPRLRVFSEAFPLLDCPTHKKIISQLTGLKKKLFTPTEFSQLLLSLGFMDDSDNKLLDSDDEITVGS